MKKELAYATIAFLLGAVLMFAPFWAFLVQIKADNHFLAPMQGLSSRNPTPENFKAISEGSEAYAGVVPRYPMDALSVSLMLTFSIIFALIVSSTLKKRMA